LPLVPSTRYAGVLFDKDGTLIDFHLTWGPAVFAMIHRFAAGNPALVQAQADALQYSIETKRFLESSPLVAGSTADYGGRWADALGRSDLDVLKSEIDALSATESLKALTPIDEPPSVFSALRTTATINATILVAGEQPSSSIRDGTHCRGCRGVPSRPW
jgi:phosphoglycolate phosphatase